MVTFLGRSENECHINYLHYVYKSSKFGEERSGVFCDRSDMPIFAESRALGKHTL